MQMITLVELHTDVLQLILAQLDASSLVHIGASNKLFKDLTEDEALWRELSLTDWPWFFWNGKCERTAFTYQISAGVGDADEAGEVLTKCPCRHSVRQHPGIPLPASYRQAYRLIAQGGCWSGFIHVLNSLSDRPMSAFIGLATYNKPSKSFLITYKPEPLLRARSGQRVIVQHPPTPDVEMGANPLEPIAEESIPLTQRHRFRRVPEELLDLDPREYYARDLFSTPPPLYWSSDREEQAWMPGNLKPGDEVEIQWRMRPSYGYGWWRGFVSGWHRQGPEDANAGIVVMFPHYPPRSHWRSVIVDVQGIPRPNFQPQIGREFGAVGGVRKVQCIKHTGLWRAVFRRVSWYDERNVEPAVQQAPGALQILVGGDEAAIQLLLNNNIVVEPVDQDVDMPEE
ncbi:hypothetical protein SmJEL517_g06135 [Synchytrium microbalum]|uniref:F-box domain-containing protein n=1 Tax=Synchytrium microbalum TaxID=1806994 RepID=A0A507BWZ6_9FUNG|nr:uncharacterized protein SmJEL517_g06135 [Synchytrium microbalum]TPX30266.1 hypothetical protein SmJEL517_g06135 [Synchytrium microbalum]